MLVNLINLLNILLSSPLLTRRITYKMNSDRELFITLIIGWIGGLLSGLWIGYLLGSTTCGIITAYIIITLCITIMIRIIIASYKGECGGNVDFNIPPYDYINQDSGKMKTIRLNLDQ